VENFYVKRVELSMALDGSMYEDVNHVLVATLPEGEGLQLYNVTLTGEEYFEFCQWLSKK
jgi:hypothetical protein